jgi:hypothetical protein
MMVSVRSLLLPLSAALLVALPACDGTGTVPRAIDRTTVFEQSFNSDTDGWVTNETAGQQGWCGALAQQSADAGPARPSAGAGYAVAEGAACNDYWQDQGFPRSGPFSPSGGFDSTWPENGFVNEIDLYLDPGWPAGAGFGFSVSALDQDGNHLKSNAHSGYFVLEVVADKSTGDLLLGTATQTTFTPPQDLEDDDHFAVPRAGWYTVRHTFHNDGGTLTVDIEVLRGERLLFDATHPTSFDIASTVGGNEYAWFTFITDGLSLPIDEHRLRE